MDAEQRHEVTIRDVVPRDVVHSDVDALEVVAWTTHGNEITHQC